MKMSLRWHKECLVNQERNFKEKEESVARYVAELEQNRKQLEFSRAQVAEAERRGLDGYDDERLLVKRSKNA